VHYRVRHGRQGGGRSISQQGAKIKIRGHGKKTAGRSDEYPADSSLVHATDATVYERG